jgi:N-acetyl-anhydromuramyl-L-alanine amidase AmpD
LNVRQDFRVTDLRGLDRRADATDFPRDLRNKLQQQGRWKRQLGSRAVDLVVIHTTEHGEAPFQNVARYLQRKRLTHYLVARDGTVYEIVPESNKAYGAGQSLWEGRYAVDHESINIEILANTAPNQYKGGITQAQYRSTKKLLANIRSRRPAIHDGRVVTHRMVAVSYKYGTRSRKGDPYEFDWAAIGLPDNSQLIDQDVLLRRIRLCTDERYVDRVTEGQNAASRFLHTL